MTKIKVEFHAHTVWSADSLLDIDKLLETCEQKGIHKIAITDHNRMGGALQAKALDPQRVIVGEEILTDEGEILGYFMQEEIPAGLAPMAVIERLKDQGAFISLAHPFDRARSNWRPQTLHAMLPFLDGLEVFNARCLSQSYNRAAADFSRLHGLLPLAGSDAHTSMELGQAAMTLPNFEDAEGLRKALASASMPGQLSSAAVHFSSTWAKLVKRIRSR